MDSEVIYGFFVSTTYLSIFIPVYLCFYCIEKIPDRAISGQFLADALNYLAKI